MQVSRFAGEVGWDNGSFRALAHVVVAEAKPFVACQNLRFPTNAMGPQVVCVLHECVPAHYEGLCASVENSFSSVLCWAVEEDFRQGLWLSFLDHECVHRNVVGSRGLSLAARHGALGCPMSWLSASQTDAAGGFGVLARGRRWSGAAFLLALPLRPFATAFLRGGATFGFCGLTSFALFPTGDRWLRAGGYECEHGVECTR